MTMTRRGFALIAALWLVVTIGALSLAAARESHSERLRAINLLELARARAAADAGIEHARSRLAERLRVSRDHGARDASLLLDPWRDLRGLLDDTLAMGDQRYQVRVRDNNAQLSLNVIDEETARRLFDLLRVDHGRADSIAQAIIDWRDPDDFRRGRGAERSDYLAAGLPILPDNGPFRSLSSLQHVSGMRPGIYAAARDDLTVLGSGRVNLNSAGPTAMRALPGITEETAAVLLRTRRSAHHVRSLAELSMLLSNASRAQLEAAMSQLLPIASFDTREVEAVSDGWVDGGRVHVRVTALFVRTDDDVLVVWRRSE